MKPNEPNEESLKNEIAADIKKHGFPLEIRVIKSCLMRNHLVDPNIRYDVGDAHKEIDVQSRLVTSGKLANGYDHFTASRLIIECKQTTLPWVFFSSPVHRDENMVLHLLHRSDLNRILRKSGLQSMAGRFYDARTHHYGDTTIPRCISYVVSPRGKKQSERSAIFDSVESVLTFTATRIEEGRPKNRPDIRTEFFYPVIVVEGDLFEATVTDDDVHIERRNHILLVNNRYDYLQMIDVVRIEHFPSYLEMIARNHSDAVRMLQAIHVPSDIKE